MRFLKSDLAFVLLFAILATFYYDSVLDKAPLNVHVWRQTDCLSITHFYMQGAPFLEPEMHNLLADGRTSGKSAGEFPILYYLVGKFWKTFGESYMSYRIFWLLILFCGTYAFYWSVKQLLKNQFWAIVVSMFLFTSPVYAAYGVSFLTDVPAFCCLLIGLAFLLKYHFSKSTQMFWIAVLFIALAGLLKVSSLIAFVFLGLILILETSGIRSLKNRNFFPSIRLAWVGFSAIIVALIAWYGYAAFYNDLHGFKYTFNSIHPIWIMSKAELISMMEEAALFATKVYFSRITLILIACIFVYNLTRWHRMNLMQNLSNLVIPIGGFLYFILWAPLMGNHDYYYVALVILLPAVILPFLAYVKDHHTGFFGSRALQIVATLLIIYNAIYARDILKLKTINRFDTVLIKENTLFKSLMRWNNYNSSSEHDRYTSMRISMEKMGISTNAKVIALKDPTINASLYYMDLRGWTAFQSGKSKKDILELIDAGAEYLIIGSNQMNEDYLQDFLDQELIAQKGLHLFKLPS